MRRVAALLVMALAATATHGDATEVVIRADRLEPRVLQATTADRVIFVNRSGRPVHVEFGPDGDRHHVFQVPARIWAVFHQTGVHRYVVHFLTGEPRELHGVVDVGHVPEREPAADPPTCRSITVEGVCLEP